MVDVQETPAVPPFDPKGDVRYGYLTSGALLVALGWGAGVVLNIVLHLTAPSSGHRLWHLFLAPTLGPYALAVLGLGSVTGALGVVLLVLGRQSPRGPFVLPGAEY